jgi:PAS domain-containing protein
VLAPRAFSCDHSRERSGRQGGEREDGAVRAVLHQPDDVTQRVRAEADVTASEERLRLAVAATGLGVFACDLATDRVIADARFREMLGLPDGDAVLGAAMLGGVVHPEDRALVEAKLVAAFDPRSAGAYQFEHRAVTPAGEVLWLLRLRSSATVVGDRGVERCSEPASVAVRAVSPAGGRTRRE